MEKSPVSKVLWLLFSLKQWAMSKISVTSINNTKQPQPFRVVTNMFHNKETKNALKIQACL
jgi:hypothetical protein